MSHKVKKASNNPQNNLYHYALIKLLIEDDLKLWHDNWVDFLSQNGFDLVGGSLVEKDSQHNLEIEGLGKIS